VSDCLAIRSLTAISNKLTVTVNVGPGFIIPSTYGYVCSVTEPVPLKCGKLATKYQWIYGFFLQLLNTSRWHQDWRLPCCRNPAL